MVRLDQLRTTMGGTRPDVRVDRAQPRTDTTRRDREFSRWVAPAPTVCKYVCFLVSEGCRHDRFRGFARAVLGARPEVGVRVEGRCRLRVAEGALNGHHIAAGRDEAGGVEVAQVMRADTVGLELRALKGGTRRDSRRCSCSTISSNALIGGLVVGCRNCGSKPGPDERRNAESRRARDDRQLVQRGRTTVFGTRRTHVGRSPHSGNALDEREGQ
jgi:hypothetical protein